MKQFSYVLEQCASQNFVKWTAVTSCSRSVLRKYWGFFKLLFWWVTFCVWLTFSFFFSLVLAELEFVQIIIIIVVITVMVVVIICLLNHYKLSTRSFINRQSQSRRQEETLQTVSMSPLYQVPSCAVWSAAQPPEELWYRQLLGKLLMSHYNTFCSLVIYYWGGIFQQEKRPWNKFKVHCLIFRPFCFM